MKDTAGFDVDLTNCDREPIHIPGSIQGDVPLNVEVRARRAVDGHYAARAAWAIAVMAAAF